MVVEVLDPLVLPEENAHATAKITHPRDAPNLSHRVGYPYGAGRSLRPAPGCVPAQGGGGARSTVRGLVTTLLALLVLVGLSSYLVLPGVLEDQLARRLQGALGAATQPEVEVSSDFPPEMLLGRIDRVRVSTERMILQGVAFYEARADLRGVDVSVASLIEGSPRIEVQSCALRAESPAVYIDQDNACLGYLGLGSF